MNDHVALTFDDGPDPRWTPRVLAALRAVGALATFFVIAPRAAAAPRVIAAMRAAGHAVELHCDEHVRHGDRSAAQITDDRDRALRRLAGMGVVPRRWRPPWGEHAPWTARLAADAGLQLVGWDADTEDWRGDTAPVLLARVEQDLRPGCVILAHDGIGPGARRTECAATVELIGPLVALARRGDLEPATLDGRVRR